MRCIAGGPPVYEKALGPCPVLVSPVWVCRPPTLRTLTSLNKEVRPFFLSDTSIWSLPSVSSLSDYSIQRSWRLFYLAIIAIIVFGVIVPKYYYRLGKIDKSSPASLFKEVTVFKA